MTKHPDKTFAWAVALAFSVGAQAQAQPSGFLPSSPHLILKIKGEKRPYYLIEPEQPLLATLDGPGLLELTLRRAVFPDEPEGIFGTLQVSIDDQVQPPITIRRTSAPGLRFVEETRFEPSAALVKKIRIRTGTHKVEIKLGQTGVAVAASIIFRRAPGAANEEPELVALPRTRTVKDAASSAQAEAPAPAATEPEVGSEGSETKGQATELSADDEPSAPLLDEGDTELVATDTTPVEPEPAPDLTAGTDHANDAVVTAKTDREAAAEVKVPAKKLPFLSLEAGLGMSTTFINIGGPAPSMHLGARYILPWLEQTLSAGLQLGLTRYNVHSSAASAVELDASNVVVPLLAVVAWSPRPLPVLHLEVGAGAGLAVNVATISYQGRPSTAAGVGAAAALFGEAGVRLGPGRLFGRAQLDAIAAGNEIFRGFDYGGLTLAAGYRQVI